MINDGEATPLQILEDGYSVEDGIRGIAPRRTNNKRTSSIIVRALRVSTAIVAVGALLLLMAGPSKRTTINSSRSSNVDGMVVVSSAINHLSTIEACYVAEGTFSGLSCKNSRAFGESTRP